MLIEISPRLLQGQRATATTPHPEEIDVGVELFLHMHKVSLGDVYDGEV